jgi:hypothetical protein
MPLKREAGKGQESKILLSYGDLHFIDVVFYVLPLKRHSSWDPDVVFWGDNDVVIANTGRDQGVIGKRADEAIKLHHGKKILHDMHFGTIALLPTAPSDGKISELLSIALDNFFWFQIVGKEKDVKDRSWKKSADFSQRLAIVAIWGKSERPQDIGVTLIHAASPAYMESYFETRLFWERDGRLLFARSKAGAESPTEILLLPVDRKVDPIGMVESILRRLREKRDEVKGGSGGKILIALILDHGIKLLFLLF